MRIERKKFPPLLREICGRILDDKKAEGVEEEKKKQERICLNVFKKESKIPDVREKSFVLAD